MALLAQAEQAMAAAGVEHGGDVEDALTDAEAHRRHHVRAVADPDLVGDASADAVMAQAFLAGDGTHRAPQLRGRGPGDGGTAAAVARAARGLERQPLT